MADSNKAKSIKVIIGTIVIALVANGIIGSLKPQQTASKQDSTSKQTVVEETKKIEVEANTTATDQVKEAATNSATTTVTAATPLSTTSANSTETTQTTSTSQVIKKSSTGICHAPGTTYYDRTTNYTSYNSVQDCLGSGGRLPKK